MADSTDTPTDGGPVGSNELVRVRTSTGIETNVGRLVAEASDDLTILDDEPAQVAFGKARPATREGGRPILPTTTVDAEAAKKKAAPSAGGSKA